MPARVRLKGKSDESPSISADVPLEIFSELLCDIRAVNMDIVDSMDSLVKEFRDVTSKLGEAIDKANEGIEASTEIKRGIEEAVKALQSIGRLNEVPEERGSSNSDNLA